MVGCPFPNDLQIVVNWSVVGLSPHVDRHLTREMVWVTTTGHRKEVSSVMVAAMLRVVVMVSTPEILVLVSQVRTLWLVG